jgi:hypothetical protein
LCLKLINLKSNPMNIFGRVFGGFLVLISLGWLATIAGIRPGNNSNNQINSDPTATNVASPAKTTTAVTPAATSKTQTSTFSTSNTGATTTNAQVEKNPRDATTPAQSGTLTSPAAPAQPTAPTAAPPVAAGW